MARKPEWLKKLESEEVSRLWVTDQPTDIEAMDSRILKEASIDLWEKVKQTLQKTLQHAELRGCKFKATPVGKELRIEVLGPKSRAPRAIYYASFVPRTHKFRLMEGNSNASWWVTQFSVNVIGGRFVLSGGEQVVQDDARGGLSEKICQLLMEPGLRPLVPVKAQKREGRLRRSGRTKIK